MEKENKKESATAQKNEAQKPNLQEIKKAKARRETAQFKSKYFEYYDDIKISDRQDW